MNSIPSRHYALVDQPNGRPVNIDSLGKIAEEDGDLDLWKAPLEFIKALLNVMKFSYS